MPVPGTPPAADPNFADAGSLSFDRNSGNATLTCIAVTGRSYQVEYSANLQTWSQATGVLLACKSLFAWTDDGIVTGSLPTNSTKRFYRIKDVTP